MSFYEKMKTELATGWNTWNTFSIYSHVCLPECFSISLIFKDGISGKVIRNGYIGHYPQSMDKNTDSSIPGPRSYDGRYTELDVTWRENRFKIQSATEDGDLVLLLTPIAPDGRKNTVAVEGAMLWNHPGMVTRTDTVLHAKTLQRTFSVHTTSITDDDPYFHSTSAYLVCPLVQPLGISTGRGRTLDEIKQIVARRRQEILDEISSYGQMKDIYEAVRCSIAWNTIYDPSKNRVITPVSRVWNCGWNSYVLFCWDTYFAGLMAGIDCKEIAYANVIEITREITDKGFIPGFSSYGVRGKSEILSQPPVGSRVVLQLYKKWEDRWLLEEIFDDLLRWNRWWPQERMTDRWLGWGADKAANKAARGFNKEKGGTLTGAKLESGLDNSPMFDQTTFNDTTDIMNLADVGLNSMYIMDCNSLAEIAEILGRSEERNELQKRAACFAGKLKELWDGNSGIYRNLHTDTGKKSSYLSPTNFYPLCSKVPTQAQAERMINEHLLNPEEFWGEWVLPSISRKDPGFEDQTYWRGRIWGPMNQIVYWGLLEYDFPEVRKKLADASMRLLLKEWREYKHVHENYNAITGEGCDSTSSNRFYHWGALLGLIALLDAGLY